MFSGAPRFKVDKTLQVSYIGLSTIELTPINPMTKHIEIAKNNEVILSVKEAAEMLGKGRSTVNRWINEHILPAERNEVGDHEIKESDVKAFMMGGQQVTSAPKVYPLQPKHVSKAGSESAHQQGREPELVESKSPDKVELLEEKNRALVDQVKKLQHERQIDHSEAEKLAIKREKEILESEKKQRNQILEIEEESKKKELRRQREHEDKLLVKEAELAKSEKQNEKQLEALAASDSYNNKQEEHEKKIMDRGFIARLLNREVKKDFKREDFSHLLTDQREVTSKEDSSVVDRKNVEVLESKVEDGSKEGTQKNLNQDAKVTDTVH